MRRLKLTIAYDGADFAGFQSQQNQRTIQGELEKALKKVTGETIIVYGAGRTDAGVHARGQVVHLTTNTRIPTEKWVWVFNHMLPRDLAVIHAEEVSDGFHARYDACWKRYRYEIDTHAIPDVFTGRYRTRIKGELNQLVMREAAQHLLGTHDFTALSSAKSAIKNRVRTLYQCDVESMTAGISITTAGNGFLYNMVRIIAGLLVQVGKGSLLPEQVPEIIASRDRGRIGKTLPPEGLTLMEVSYQPWEKSLHP
ncbi:tRNA pseudouridine(38-40) synthase TruA [Marininema halotolerans]|uniref:tRNA pseudouridine synthase A n=1 Tax=Marininema halotolerans TaxID=1155944 RepID=A0A1I6T4S1_9BACL|nr:tRNA pseudouridine(38-40) synthase TruA [Marininema halotolerans]SFS84232.1 tRNA pseudouridine38-40 synthase [Marininema halotolerans]